jgi:hypothetical protein
MAINLFIFITRASLSVLLTQQSLSYYLIPNPFSFASPRIDSLIVIGTFYYVEFLNFHH